MSSQFVLGFDVGGTKSSVILAGREGNILGRISGPTEIAEGPMATVNRFINDARSLMDENSVGSEQILGIGICSGSPLDRTEGIIYSPPNLPGWDSVPIVKMSEDALGLPAALENDADCCALAELFFGAGKGKQTIVAFTWGTGIGAGIIINGRVYTGSSGMAGEIGHVVYEANGRACGCGKRGCIEAYGSGSSIVRIAREMVERGQPSSLSDVDAIDGQAICDAARAGDQLAIDVLTRAARAMGRAVSIAAHTVNPEVVVLGTMAVKAGDLLMPEVNRVVESEVWEGIRRNLAIVPSPLGDRVQDLAAISAFLGRL